MSAVVCGLVWHRDLWEGSARALFVDVVRCLPSADTRLRALKAYGAQNDVPDSPLGTWAFARDRSRADPGIPPEHIEMISAVLAEGAFLDRLWYLEATRQLQPTPEDGDFDEVFVGISWPGLDQSSRCAPVEIDFRKLVWYWRLTHDHPNLRYITDVFTALEQTETPGHGVVWLDENELAPANCFLVWHRDIKDFALDLLWILVAAVSEGPYMSPAIMRASDPAGSLVHKIRTECREQNEVRGSLYSARDYDPETYSAPRLNHRTLAQLLADLDEVARRIAAVDRDELLDIAEECMSCVLQRTGTGGCLWAKAVAPRSRGAIHHCVDEFYLALAHRVLPSTASNG